MGVPGVLEMAGRVFREARFDAAMMKEGPLTCSRAPGERTRARQTSRQGTARCRSVPSPGILPEPFFRMEQGFLFGQIKGIFSMGHFWCCRATEDGLALRGPAAEMSEVSLTPRLMAGLSEGWVRCKVSRFISSSVAGARGRNSRQHGGAGTIRLHTSHVVGRDRTDNNGGKKTSEGAVSSTDVQAPVSDLLGSSAIGQPSSKKRGRSVDMQPTCQAQTWRCAEHLRIPPKRSAVDSRRLSEDQRGKSTKTVAFFLSLWAGYREEIPERAL
ncbi:hypothetical protein B0T11DRAFT_296935 [Plectosphaerella cucumerina]|uniref:Uncharacterized protein n=1 Tax=Plectosphaerella cucumerina TaxID=40658 RepID=A0A8K0TM69_9PEZI|nr:hypothetical protein B0T11DRAFT_296935 [Plectosphaerella cucumerina]